MNNILMGYEHNFVGNVGAELGDNRDKPVVKLSELVRKCEEFWPQGTGEIYIIQNHSEEIYRRLISELRQRNIDFFLFCPETDNFNLAENHFLIDLRRLTINDVERGKYDFLGK